MPDGGEKPVRIRLAGAVLLLVAGVAGCGGSGDVPVGPAPPSLPPPGPPPPPGSLQVGFAEDRVELREGEGIAVGIEFEPHYRSPPDPDMHEDSWRLDLRVIVEPEGELSGDLWVGEVPLRPTYAFRYLRRQTTWLALQALPDGEPEAPETLTLRLALVGGQPYARRRIELTNAELEVVIHDADTAAVCSDVGITATPPRRLIDRGDRPECASWGVFETEVTVEADRGAPLQLERLRSSGRIDGWRLEFAGSRIRHHFVLQWDNERSAEMRLQACPAWGGGPTLVCTEEACETYPAGAPIPAPGSPLACP